MSKVEHIGIAVRSIEQADRFFSLLLGGSHYKTELVASENVRTAFYKAGETKVELLEPTAPESPVAKFLERRGEGIHHIAFGVSDIRKEMKRLSEAGYTLLNSEPKKGADNKLVCFFHPKDTSGVLVELCQDITPPQTNQE